MSMQSYTKGYNFILGGSLLYELIIFGNAWWVLHILGQSTYGLVGSCLGLVHIGAHFFDFGAASSISPFLYLITKSRKNFRYLFLWGTVGLHTLVAGVCVIAWYVLGHHFFIMCDTRVKMLVALLVVIDVPQAVMRQFLYAVFYTRIVVASEICLMLARIGVFWMLYAIDSSSMSVALILQLHIVEALIRMLFFCAMLWHMYKKLSQEEHHFPVDIYQRCVKSRCCGYVLRVSRNMFSSSFLTPLFAVKFGLATAGVFYFVSKFAKIVQSMAKLSIGYSGNGLLASVKHCSLQAQQDAFVLLTKKLADIGTMIVVGLIVWCMFMMWRDASFLSSSAVSIAVLFLLITYAELFLMVYEQFFVMQEAVHVLFVPRVCELAVLYVMMHGASVTSITLLLGIIGMRSLHFCYVAGLAHYFWGIMPCTSNFMSVSKNIKKIVKTTCTMK